MKAVLLAAGRSLRLYPLTAEKPKCLLEIGGKTFLEYQLDALIGCGITEVVIVTGHFSHVIEEKIEQIRDRYPFEFEFVFNPHFADMNNIYSFWMAKASIIDSDFVCIYTDLIFDPRIIHQVAAAEGNIVLVADRDQLLPQTMKMRLEGNQITTVGRHVTMEEASATFLGITKVHCTSAPALFDEIEELIEAGKTDGFFTEGVEALIKKGLVVAANFTNGLPWIEVDLPTELAEAEAEFSLIAESSVVAR